MKQDLLQHITMRMNVLESQSFTYTGYQRDEVSGTYFAQAREYQPGVGRFTAEDGVKGLLVLPMTMTQYAY